MSEPSVGMFDPLPKNGLNGPFPASLAPILEYVSPVPDDAPEPPPRGSGRWRYRDERDRLIFVVDRIDPCREGERKQFVPQTLWRNEAGVLSWKSKHPPIPRPLYGLNQLARRRDAPVLVVEGEKAADAAARLFPDYVVLTSSGGANAAAKSDWFAFAGRTITIWPDNDQPGRNYAAEVRRLALVAGAASVCIVDVPRDWPDGWDLADLLPEGVAIETLQGMLVNAEKYTPAPEILEAPTEPLPLVRPVPGSRALSRRWTGTRTRGCRQSDKRCGAVPACDVCQQRSCDSHAGRAESD